jgi:hypothetical protein
MARKVGVMENAIFKSSTRSAGDIAGVFEYDGEVGFFYLYDLSREKGRQITGSLYVNFENPDFHGANVSIKWTNSQEFVGLYIQGCLWAAFDLKGHKYGGHFEFGKMPEIPNEILAKFQSL